MKHKVLPFILFGLILSIVSTSVSAHDEANATKPVLGCVDALTIARMLAATHVYDEIFDMSEEECLEITYGHTWDTFAYWVLLQEPRETKTGIPVEYDSWIAEFTDRLIGVIQHFMVRLFHPKDEH